MVVAGLLFLATQTAASAGTSTAATPKPVLRGLLDRKGMPPSSQWDVIDGFVVTATWAQLQTSPGAPLTPNNPIDQAIAAVRAQNGPAGMKLKLRVKAGVDAPQWAKQLGGDPVPMIWGNKTVTVGRFWTAPFGNAYGDLQNQLAAKYDAVPEILQTEISRCTTYWTEPYYRQWQTDRTRQAFLDAGYTAEADDVCHNEEIRAHDVWAQTRSGLSVSPFWRLSANGAARYDMAYTEDMMRYCRSVLGPRCVLENYSLRWPLLSGHYDQLHAALEALGPPLAFQTANPAKVGEWYAALNWAADIGTNSVELNQQYPTYDVTRLDAAGDRLRANPPGG